jgi:BirA family biotin operon repressor/biotin-[acetyl-CoA-carboxylase] ligase
MRLQVARSTQDVARSSYVGVPLLVIADRQEEGRGRSGSEWKNADRAVAVSCAFQPSWPQSEWGLIPLVAGVAAVRVSGGSLKWPNDLLVGDDKVGGVLVEASSGGPVVVGAGLNIWWRDPPAGMAAIYPNDPGEEAADEIASAFARSLLSILEAPASDWPRDEYLARCVTLGRDISWEPDGRGHAVDIADDGGLVVETANGRRVLRSGAVAHVRST